MMLSQVESGMPVCIPVNELICFFIKRVSSVVASLVSSVQRRLVVKSTQRFEVWKVVHSWGGLIMATHVFAWKTIILYILLGQVLSLFSHHGATCSEVSHI